MPKIDDRQLNLTELGLGSALVFYKKCIRSDPNGKLIQTPS
jgi:hypothetical protein